MISLNQSKYQSINQSSATWLPIRCNLNVNLMPLNCQFDATWMSIRCHSTWSSMRCHLTFNLMPLDCQWDATVLTLPWYFPLSFHLTSYLRPLNFEFDSTWLYWDSTWMSIRWLSIRCQFNGIEMPLDCQSDATWL